MLNIEFIANRPWLTKDSISAPKPIIKLIPEWYKKADRFLINPYSDDYYVGPDKGKVPTWKACPAIFDIFATGYAYLTPCDIEFYINEKGTIDSKIDDPNYKDFCTPRSPMPEFYQPDGYYEDHFAWFSDWAVKLPDGYSAIYMNPSNNFELPFLITEGIIDNDKVNLPGSMPFFIKQGWTGILPAGTPYAQIIPFKREDWTSSYHFDDAETMQKKNMENSSFYRVPNGGVYKNKVWEKRTYS
jgi:hypothetical protein